MAKQHPLIRIDVATRRGVSILVLDGMLDSSTYRTIRDAIIKAALDEPRAVIVDIDDLFVPSDSAWTVFTSARWHVSTWPDVPILLACAEQKTRQAIVTCGVTRYVPVHPTLESALEAACGRSPQLRRRARSELPRSRSSLAIARGVVADWLARWNAQDAVPVPVAVAATVATVFVENVLDHTGSAPTLIVESYRDAVTVAVEDSSERLPSRHEDADRGAEIVSGLAIVSALCRVWGSTPTSSGKTVWALVGRENKL